MALRFLLAGRVQEVKMRRYVESAARHFNVSGFTINTMDGKANAIDYFLIKYFLLSKLYKINKLL